MSARMSAIEGISGTVANGPNPTLVTRSGRLRISAIAQPRIFQAIGPGCDARCVDPLSATHLDRAERDEAQECWLFSLVPQRFLHPASSCVCVGETLLCVRAFPFIFL